MPDNRGLQVAILIWGCAFCTIAALCMLLSSNYDRKKRKYLVLMESFTVLLLLMDAFANIFRGHPGTVGSMVVHVSNFFVFFVNEIILACFHTYVIQFRKRISTKILLSMLSYIAFPLAAAVVQMFCYGIALINFSIGLCMIIMFLAAMSELNQEMYMLSSSESKMKERLEIATVLNRCIAQLLSEEEDNVAIFNLQGIPLEMLNICFTAED